MSQFTSDRAYDKIIIRGTTTQDVGTSSTETVTIAHGQSEALLPEVLYSIDNTNWYMCNQILYNGSSQPLFVNASSDDTNLYIYCHNEYTTGGTQTFYLRYAGSFSD